MCPLRTTAARRRPQLVRELREAPAHAGVPLELRCGGELGHDLAGTLSQAQLEADRAGARGESLAARGGALRRADRDFRAATAELRERGFGVVIAHLERVAFAEKRRARGCCDSSLRRGAWRS